MFFHVFNVSWGIFPHCGRSWMLCGHTFGSQIYCTWSWSPICCFIWQCFLCWTCACEYNVSFPHGKVRSCNINRCYYIISRTAFHYTLILSWWLWSLYLCVAFLVVVQMIVTFQESQVCVWNLPNLIWRLKRQFFSLLYSDKLLSFLIEDNLINPVWCVKFWLK